MIYGPRGLGKTMVGLNVAYAVASGGEYLGWKACAPRRVVYIDGEMPVIELQARLRSITTVTPYALPDPDYLRIISDNLMPSGLPRFVQSRRAVELMRR